MRLNRKTFMTLFLLMLFAFPVHPRNQNPQNSTAQNLRLIQIQALISTATRTKSVKIDYNQWARTLNAFAGKSQNIENLISNQVHIFRKLKGFYKPEILLVFSALMTIVDELNNNYEKWLENRKHPFISPEEAIWLKNDFFQKIRKKKIQIGAMDPLVFTPVAVVINPKQSTFLLPRSFIKKPWDIDVLAFKRVLYHELYHLLNRHEVSTPTCELKAELFAIKAMILLTGKEKTKKYVEQMFFFPEQEKTLKNLAKKIDNPEVVIKVFHKLRERVLPERMELSGRMVNLAMSELNQGFVSKERDELAVEMSQIHIEQMLFSYAAHSSIFYSDMKKKIEQGEIPENYFHLYREFVVHPRTIEAISNDNFGKIFETTIRFHTNLFVMMLQLHELTDVNGRKYVDEMIDNKIFKYAFGPLTIADLINGQLQWLIAPINFQVVYPVFMEMIVTGKRVDLGADGEKQFSFRIGEQILTPLNFGGQILFPF